MMKSTHALIALSLLPFACLGSTSSGGSSPDAGTGQDSGGGSSGGSSGGEAGAVTVVVAPATTDVLTCSTQAFTATVTGASDTSVTWSVAPATGAGAIDSTGKLTAPTATPATPTATVTATSTAQPGATGTASVTYATAFPTRSTLMASTGSVTVGDPGVFPHTMAAQGSRVYATWPSAASATPSVMLARSDDGGTTWNTPVAAIQVTLSGSDKSDVLQCNVVAIDAGNPDVVYLAAYSQDNAAADKAAGAPAGGSGSSTLFAVSTDGGMTFTMDVMQVGGTAGGPLGGWDGAGICPDVASPAANAVVYEAPGGYDDDGNPDLAIWADANRGAGFATGTALDDDYVANGVTHGLDDLKGNHLITPGSNGGTNDDGGATESPRLFTDGAGRLCIAYQGSLANSHENAYVQCSDATATTFSTPLLLDPAASTSQTVSQPIGALGPGKAAAMIWLSDVADVGSLMVATSTDAGATFGAPAALPTYLEPGGKAGDLFPGTPSIGYDAAGVLWVAYYSDDGISTLRIVVDKSCDGGQTWSGATLVNGPEKSVVNMKWPSLAMTTPVPHVVAWGTDHLNYFSLSQ